MTNNSGVLTPSWVLGESEFWEQESYLFGAVTRHIGTQPITTPEEDWPGQ